MRPMAEAMIVANLATYPKRRSHLRSVVEMIAAQVASVNVVLNEYSEVPTELEGIQGVNPIIPEHDTKDTGKFYPDTSGADFVMLIDDDIVYPPDYVQQTLLRLQETRLEAACGGYHGSIYIKSPEISLRRAYHWQRFIRQWSMKPGENRRVMAFRRPLRRSVVVDQVATNAAIVPAAHMPPYEFMRDAQKFVDVRLARWCHEHGIAQVCLRRDGHWLGAVDFDENIFDDFTDHHHPHVVEEILQFAFKSQAVGNPVP